MKKFAWIILILVIAGAVNAQTIKIKFATQAPQGSAWIKAMDAYNEDIKALTNNTVKFKIYAGGIQGDELAVLRKMRFNSIHAAGFTGMGTGEILPEFRVLEAPMLVKNYAEVDTVTHMLYDELAQKFEEKGYVLLGLTEVGFVYVFSNKPIHTLADLQTIKMWMWEGDPLVEAAFNALNVNAIPLSITDVMTSLQTNLIDAVYTSPLACVSLQWFTKVKYMINLPLTNSLGAILITKKKFKKIPAEYQQAIIQKGRQRMAELVQQSRKSNEESIELMKKNGVEIINISEEDLPELLNAGEKARNAMVGKLYSAELLARLQNAVNAIRANSPSSAK